MSTKQQEIAKWFIKDSGVDKFTSTRKRKLVEPIQLECENLSISKYYKEGIQLYFSYINSSDKDEVILELDLQKPADWNHKSQYKAVLQVSTLFFLLDNAETIQINDTWGHQAVSGSKEAINFSLTLEVLIKLAKAKNIEYRLSSNVGILSEGKFSEKDLFLIKAFYASVFDEEFESAIIISYIESKEKETLSKLHEENRKQEQKNIEILKQKKHLEEQEFKKERLNRILNRIKEINYKKNIDESFFMKNAAEIKKAVAESDHAYISMSGIITTFFVIVLFIAVILFLSSWWRGILFFVVGTIILIYMNSKMQSYTKSKLKKNQPELISLVESYIEEITT